MKETLPRLMPFLQLEMLYTLYICMQDGEPSEVEDGFEEDLSSVGGVELKPKQMVMVKAFTPTLLLTNYGWRKRNFCNVGKKLGRSAAVQNESELEVCMMLGGIIHDSN